MKLFSFHLQKKGKENCQDTKKVPEKTVPENVATKVFWKKLSS